MEFNEAIEYIPITAKNMILSADKFKSRKHLDFDKDAFNSSNIKPYSIYLPEFTLSSGTCDVNGITGIYREPTNECSIGKNIILVEFDTLVGKLYVSSASIENYTLVPYLSYYNTTGKNLKIHNCPRDNNLKINEKTIWNWTPINGLKYINKED